MPISKRDGAAVARPNTGKGRHHMLRIGSDHYMIYLWLEQNSGATSAQIRDAVSIPHPQAMARITELKNEGLIVETGESRRTGSGRTAKCLRVVTENETGHGRDLLSFVLTVYRNDRGEYSLGAKLIGEVPSALDHNPRPVGRKQINMHVPKPSEPLSTRPIFDPGHSLQVPAKSDNPFTADDSLTQDIDFEMIPAKPE